MINIERKRKLDSLFFKEKKTLKHLKIIRPSEPRVPLWRINSFLSKTEELRTLALNKNISVPGITETKLDKTVSNEELKIDDYNLLRSRSNKIGGGVACYIKKILLIIDNQVFQETLKILF